jgi:hypothetical protein
MIVYADPIRHLAPATLAVPDDSRMPFSLPAVARKKVIAAFDAVSISYFRFMVLAWRKSGPSDPDILEYPSRCNSYVEAGARCGPRCRGARDR